MDNHYQDTPSDDESRDGNSAQDNLDDDDGEEELDGHLGEATRGAAAVAPPRPSFGLFSRGSSGLEEVNPDDMAETEFSLSGEVNRSLEVSSHSHMSHSSFGFDLGPPPALMSTPAATSPVAFAATREEQSLAGVAVLDLPYYLTVGSNSAALGLSGSRNDESAARMVSDALTLAKVDYKVVANIAEWTCASFSDNASHVSFEVRLWRQEGQLVLESTRRAGDAYAFIVLHKAMVAHITGDAAPAHPQLVLEFPMAAEAPQEQLDDLSPFVAAAITSVESMTIDAVFEGTRTLACLSGDATARPVLHRCGVVGALTKLLESDPAGTMGHFGMVSELFAVTCLANLSEEPLCHTSLLGALGLLLDRVTDGTFADRCMRREAARTLRNISQDSTGADALIKAVGKDKLALWATSSYLALADDQMKDDANEVKRNVEARWVAAS